MMRGQHSETRATDEEKVEAEAKEDIAIIPLGLPLLLSARRHRDGDGPRGEEG